MKKSRISLLILVISMLLSVAVPTVSAADDAADERTAQAETPSDIVIDGEIDAAWNNAVSFNNLNFYSSSATDANQLKTTYKVLSSRDNMHVYVLAEITAACGTANSDYLRIGIGENNSWICSHDNHLHYTICKDTVGGSAAGTKEAPFTFNEMYANIPLNQEGSVHISETVITIRWAVSGDQNRHFTASVDIDAFVKKTETGYLVELDWARDCGFQQAEIKESKKAGTWGSTYAPPAASSFKDTFYYSIAPNTKTEVLSFYLMSCVNNRYNKMGSGSDVYEYLYPSTWSTINLNDTNVISVQNKHILELNYQDTIKQNKETFNVRAIATIDTLEAAAVGFLVRMSYDGKEVEKTYFGNTVYKAVYADEEKVEADEGTWFAVFTLTDIPKDATVEFEVTPCICYTEGGPLSCGATYSFTVNETTN